MVRTPELGTFWGEKAIFGEKRPMKFATVDGRTAWVDVPVGGLAAFRGDVCEVLDVCPTYIFTNMGRIVTDVVDVCGDVVVLADSNVSLLAQGPQ